MKKSWLSVGCVLLALGLAVLAAAMVFNPNLDPFGLAQWFQPGPGPFTPSRPPSPEVQALIDRLKSGNDAARIQAMTELAEHGPDAEAAVPALIDLIRSRDEDLRLNA